MSTILVVDDLPIFREPIAASLRLAGYNTLTAGDGEEALVVLKQTRPDLILLDMAMPVMDGMTFLSAIRSKPITKGIPVILLTAVSDKEHVLKAAKLGIADYLLKSRFSLAELLARVKAHLGGFTLPDFHGSASASTQSPTTERAARLAPARKFTRLEPISAPAAGATAATIKSPPAADEPPTPFAIEGIPRLLTREACLRRMINSLQTKTLCGVVTQVAALAASPRGDTADLAGTIQRDPLLTARVMQAANSPAYISNGGPAASVKEAVRRMGFTGIRNIAMALGIFEVMPETKMEGFDAIRHWQHSLAVAALCEHLAAKADPQVDGTAYLLGICHDLGEILFYRHFGKEYQQIIETAARTGRTLVDLEQAMLGITRAETELLLLKTLRLPDAIQEPIIQFQKNPQACDAEHRGPLLILRLANAYANGLLLASGPKAPVRPLSCAECRSGTGSDSPARPDGAALRSEILGLTAMLARNVEDAALRPMYPKRDRNVLLVRAPGLSAFDPLEAALGALAKVTVATSLPDHTAAIDALVVLAPSTAASGFAASDIDRVKAVSGGKSVPVLWLVGTPAPQVLAGPQPTVWPMGLDQLAEFVRKSGQGDASAIEFAG